MSLVEMALEVNTDKWAVIHLDEDVWRFYSVRLVHDVFKVEGDTSPRAHPLRSLFAPILSDSRTEAWWRLCFVNKGDTLMFDDYYLWLPMAEGSDRTFKQLFSELERCIPSFSISSDYPILLSGHYARLLPLVYYFRKRYQQRFSIHPGHLVERTMRLYREDKELFYVFPDLGYQARKLIYHPYRPGEQCGQSYVWLEQDRVGNIYQCFLSNRGENKLIPWNN